MSFASAVSQPVGTALGTALAERVIARPLLLPPPPRAESESEKLRDEVESFKTSEAFLGAVPWYLAAVVGAAAGFLLFTGLAPKNVRPAGASQ